MARLVLAAILVFSLAGCAADEVGGGAVEAGAFMALGYEVAGEWGDESDHVPKESLVAIPQETLVAADTTDRVIDYTLPTRIYALPEDSGANKFPFQDLAIFDVNPEPMTGPSLVERLHPSSEKPIESRKSPIVTEISPTPIPPVSGGVTGNSYQIQLGALPSKDSARREWTRIERRYPDLVRNQTQTIIPVELDPQIGKVFRLRTGPISEIKTATSLCRKFRSAGQDCFVVKFESPS
ncbi:MAG: SPOR domain-containing protein [Planctomycetota bacterium]|nr:SPOR domain-containing protein [Planctomycetota bacterium]